MQCYAILVYFERLFEIPLFSFKEVTIQCGSAGKKSIFAAELQLQ